MNKEIEWVPFIILKCTMICWRGILHEVEDPTLNFDLNNLGNTLGNFLTILCGWFDVHLINVHPKHLYSKKKLEIEIPITRSEARWGPPQAQKD